METPSSIDKTIASAAIELIDESRTALGLAKGAKLSDAIALLVKFMRDWDGLHTDLGGPFDDGTFRATADEFYGSIRALRSSSVSPDTEATTPDASDVEWVEEEVGMGAGAWDMVRAEKIVAAAWRRLRSRYPAPSASSVAVPLELPYAAVSHSGPEGRAMEWAGPLWDAIHAWAAATPTTRGTATNRVTDAVHAAMRLAIETALADSLRAGGTEAGEPKLDTHERRELEFRFSEWVAKALNQAWDDFTADTGCFPECLKVSKDRRGVYVEADFRSSNFALYAAGWLLGNHPELVPVIRTASSPSEAPTSTTTTPTTTEGGTHG